MRGGLGALLVLGLCATTATPQLVGRQSFTDRRDPPPWRTLPPEQQAEFDLGLLIFNTPWVVVGAANAARIDGLGPLFISASCDGCHNNGARARPPLGNEGLSNSFVMQLGAARAHPYGAVLNTAAIADHAREGAISVAWTVRSGQYADGAGWSLRVPRYAVTRWLYGAPDARTALKPRVAPAVYGTGLLEKVPRQALRELRARQPRGQRGILPQGRFGWQAEALDVEDQTALAFAREMGLSTARHPADDCTPTQIACRAAPNGGAPEVSAEFLRAVVTYERELAVPARAVRGSGDDAAGRRLFESTGCAICHVPQLPVQLDDVATAMTDRNAGNAASIDAFTDLLLHDLGDDLADRDLAGRLVKSAWRTAPLWGLSHARRREGMALLHDGRARSVEEAVLWHGGQAASSREAFTRLTASDRARLLEWVGSL